MNKQEKQGNSDAALRVLFPGRSVPVMDGRATVVVYPLGLRHARKFATEIVGMIAAATNMPAARAVGTGDFSGPGARAVLSAFAPSVIESLIDLVQECSVFKPGDELRAELEAAGAGDATIRLSDLAHWDVPAIIDAWLEESFAGGKWRAWLKVVEDLVERATGTRPNFSQALQSIREQPTAAE